MGLTLATPAKRRNQAFLRVYQCNITAMLVFLECTWTLIALADGRVMRTHLDAHEINAVMHAKRIPSTERQDVFLTVRIMQRAALAVYNAPK